MPDTSKPSIAALALGLMKQIAPGVFDTLSDAGRQGILAALAPLDAAAGERVEDAIKRMRLIEQSRQAASPAPELAFEVPADSIDEADAAGDAAGELAMEADKRDATGGATPHVAGGCAERQALALSSLAFSAREACILLRAIAGALEIRKGQ